MCAKFNALVLAAGLGTRMRPITSGIPKPLIRICNRPLLGIILERLVSAGVGRVAVNTHYLPEKVREYVSASPYREIVDLFHEEEILGTGGPDINARGVLSEHDCYIHHNGDILSDVDLGAMVNEHRRRGAVATLLTLDGPENRLRVLDDGTVVDILGRTGLHEGEGVSATFGGVAVFSRRIFDYLPADVCNCSIIPAIIRAIIEEPGSVTSYNSGGAYWNDLGTVDRYFRAHVDLLRDGVSGMLSAEGKSSPLLLAPGAVATPESLNGFVCVGEGAVVESGAHVENCVVLEGARIRAGELHVNEVIGADFSVHRDVAALRGLKLLKDLDFERCRISSLREYGSARGFFRLEGDGNSRILMVSEASDADFNRFIDIGRFLAAERLYTPEIYDFKRDEYAVLMEDLGNEMLYNFQKNHVNDVGALRENYGKVAEALADFQLRGTRVYRGQDKLGIRVFDYDYLRWETAYFKANFLMRLRGLGEGDCVGIDAEFDALAAAVDRHPKILMHRDFQSQNIMLWRGCPRFVDFQGARIGPVGYDIMSLLRDPYVKLPRELRADLFRHYADCFLSSPLNDFVKDEAEFRRYAVLAGLQRNMQALGAYGFLALERGKRAYLAYVPRALGYLREGLDELRSLDCGLRLDALERLWPELEGFTPEL